METYLSNVIAGVQAKNTYRKKFINEDGLIDYAHDESIYIDNLDDLMIKSDAEIRDLYSIDDIPISFSLEDGYYRGDASDEELKKMESLDLCEIEYDENGEIDYVSFKELDDILAERYRLKAIKAINAAKENL